MITGQHVTLSAIDTNDLPQLLEWRNQLRKYFRQFTEISEAQQKEWYEGLKDDWSTIMFAIHEKVKEYDVNPKGELLGACGLTYIDWKNRTSELSCYIGRHYADDKYTPDVLRLLIDYCFGELGLHKLWAEVYEFNTGNKTILEQMGFHTDGTLRDNLWREGRWWNSTVYSLLYPEWLTAISYDII